MRTFFVQLINPLSYLVTNWRPLTHQLGTVDWDVYWISQLHGERHAEALTHAVFFPTVCLSSFCFCFVGGRADHQSIWRRWWWLWNEPVDWQKLSGFPLQTFPLIMTTRNLEWDVKSLSFSRRCQCWLWTTCTRIWLQWWRTNTGCRDTSPSLTLCRQQRRASDQHSKAPLMTWGKVRGMEFKIYEYIHPFIHPSTLPEPYGVQVAGAAAWAEKPRLPSPKPPLSSCYVMLCYICVCVFYSKCKYLWTLFISRTGIIYQSFYDYLDFSFFFVACQKSFSFFIKILIHMIMII